jgi:Uma2 family endonuclease
MQPERVTQITKTRISLAEALAMPESLMPMEYISGELIRYPLPKEPHGRTVGDVLFFLAQNVSIGTVLHGPLDIFLGENVLQPDIVWISLDSCCQTAKDGYLYGAPDLVVEILEDGRDFYDRGVKFKLYEQYCTREYWLIEPNAKFVEVYRRVYGHFERQGIWSLGEVFHSAVLGDLAIEVNALFGIKPSQD